jgi:hypothetical protein
MLTPRGVYPGSELSTSGVPPNDGNSYPYDLEGLLRAVERQVPVIDVADLLCGPAGNRSGWRRVGDLWVARCPLPDHKCPWSFSFTVSIDENRWYCCECRVEGDVLDLYAFAGTYTDKAQALTALARERGMRP